MGRTTRADPDRLLVRDGWKHYRRTYSMTEVRWGLAVLATLVAIVAWVAWRGQHPDPSLYSATPIAAGSGAATEVSSDRGPVPTGLAAPGWTEGPVSAFDAENLYVKINGRADFFLSKGFQTLYFLSLSFGDDTVDIEMYDMGRPENAVGAFSAERREGVEVESVGETRRYSSRNALFVARGPHYVRAIGSSESDAVTAQLDHLAAALDAGIASAERPWAYDLFVGQLGLEDSKVTYKTQSAFSFEFAKDVFVGDLGDDTSGFVVARKDAGDAEAFAKQFMEGFLSIGKPDGEFAVDEFIDTYSIAIARDRFVIGVQGAPNRAAAQAALDRMKTGLAGLPAQTLERAQSAAPLTPALPPAPEESYDE